MFDAVRPHLPAETFNAAGEYQTPTGWQKPEIDHQVIHVKGKPDVAMDITVVNLRTELPPFYRRFGYEISGEMPPPERLRSRIPCHLIKMSKTL